MSNIQDFGQKIGGARKDEWRLRGLTQNDLQGMTDLERETYVKKDNVWPRPNWEEVIANGTPQAVAYWQNKVRQAIPPKPVGSSEEHQQNYIKAVSSLRDDIMAVRTMAEVRDFYDDVLIPKYTYDGVSYSYHYIEFLPEMNGIYTNKFSKALRGTYWLEEKAKKELFGIPKDKKAYTQAKQGMSVHCYDGEQVTIEPRVEGEDDKGIKVVVATPGCREYFYQYSYESYSKAEEWEKGTYFVVGPNRHPIAINFATKEEAEAFVENYATKRQEEADKAPVSEWTKSGKNRKKNFVPPQLKHVQYTGPKYRGIRNATGDMYLEDLKFRGGEFGNWLNHEDRQTSLNMGYDALCHLADLLNIRREDVSLNGALAIAFGARGKGGANAGAAHYEPLRQVINLTKMSGAGCLAHEWGHALDHAIGIMCGGTGFASEQGKRAQSLPSFVDLCASFRRKETNVSAEQQAKERDEKLAPAIQGLSGCLDSAKPSDLPPPAEKAWDDAAQYILNNSSSFSGFEYLGYRNQPSTHPYVEVLSQISKTFTNHVVPMKVKEQIVLWSREINMIKARYPAVEDVTRNVETDFYKGSKVFDEIYSKMGQGYWSSSCEMFARAFDCYIADKLAEQGVRSDFLTSNADSFSAEVDGKIYYAYPRGEERKAFNAAFDQMICDLKDLGLLHDAPVIEASMHHEAEKNTTKHYDSFPEPEPGKVHYEQLSLDDLLFSAASRANATTAASPSRKKNDIAR